MRGNKEINLKSLKITLQDVATACSEFDRCRIQTQDCIRYTNKDYERKDYNDLNGIFNLPSVLDK